MKNAARGTSRTAGLRRMPWLGLALVAAGLAASFVPGAPERWIYDRSLVEGGAWWRLLSAHLVHSSVPMAAMDLGACLVLGAWIEVASRGRLAATLLAAAVGVGAAVHWGLPDLARYHGASGLASALFVLLAADLARRGTRAGRLLAVLALTGFVAKTLWELQTGRGLSLPGGVPAVPEAHLAGAAVGLALSLIRLDPARSKADS